MFRTNLNGLDSFWDNGLRAGGLILLAARPGMGKTSFLLSIGNLLSRNHRTLFISLENPESELKNRNIASSILLDDSKELDMGNLEEKIISTKSEVVLIDYLQLLSGIRESLIENLKSMAVSSNCCIMVNSQIGREPEYRDLSQRRPTLNDLLVSGSLFGSDISYVDNLTFLYQDKYYNPLSSSPGVIDLIQYDNNSRRIIKFSWSDII